MAKICQDRIGLYARVGGYVVRPKRGCGTSFGIGEKVVGKHFGGSTMVGMGKLPGRGEYQEYWCTDYDWTAKDIQVGSKVGLTYGTCLPIPHSTFSGVVVEIEPSQSLNGTAAFDVFDQFDCTIEDEKGNKIKSRIYYIELVYP